MKASLVLLCCVFLGVLHVEVKGATTSKPYLSVEPGDVVQLVGRNATFNCKIEKEEKATEFVVWTRTLVGEVNSEEIHTTLGNKTAPYGYDFIQNPDDLFDTSIVVKDLKLSDAGRYKCAPMTVPANGRSGQLVVVREPKITIAAPLYEGEVGKLTCVIFYNAESNIDQRLEPQLHAALGGVTLPTINVQKTGTSKRYRLRLDFEREMQATNHGQEFICGAKVDGTGFREFRRRVIEIYTLHNKTCQGIIHGKEGDSFRLRFGPPSSEEDTSIVVNRGAVELFSIWKGVASRKDAGENLSIGQHGMTIFNATLRDEGNYTFSEMHNDGSGTVINECLVNVEPQAAGSAYICIQNLWTLAVGLILSWNQSCVMM